MMENLQPHLQKAQEIILNTMDAVAPFVDTALDHIHNHVLVHVAPYYAHLVDIVDTTVLTPAKPYYGLLLQQIAPLLLLVAQAQALLPTFDEYPLNYVGIAAIVLHVLIYNITAQIEYHTRLFSRIFGKAAIHLYAIFLILSALIRDHYLMRAIEKDAGSRILFEQDTADSLSVFLIIFGIFLNLWVLAVLGWKNMYNGDSFGYLLPAPITHGPFYYFDDPQYFGTTLMLLGYAVRHQSRIGYGLTGVMYLAFSFSAMLIEGPHQKRIYEAAAKKKKDATNQKNKEKKNN